MSTPAHIVDGFHGTRNKACVTKIGQLVTTPFRYDETEFKELAVNDTAYNFYSPKHEQQFVITGIVAVGDQQITANSNADVVVYEATAPDTTTVEKVLFQTAIARDSFQGLPSLNILVNKGVWINAKTTDDDVHMTIMGYYIPEL